MGKAGRTVEGLLTRRVTVLFIIALLGTLIYSNTFSVPFVFDDNRNIVENPRIRHLTNLSDFSGSRYVGFLSFALNYHFGGLNVFGYHVVNLLIHIINGFLVYHLVLLLFRAVQGSQQPGQTQESAPASYRIALSTALLFIVHPIQTQAVTYTVQRFASLAALFYLLTVVCFLRWRLAPSEGRRRYLWYVGALLSTVLAMKTKEVSFTLPFMILLMEAVFFRSFVRKRWASLVPFLLTLPMIPFSRIDAVGEAEVGFAQETTEISRADYFFTQFRVIMTYLRLLVLPINQNLDYDYPIYHSFFEPPVFFSFLFLLSLLALSLYLLFNSKFKTVNSQLIAIGLLWFFLTLSVESSIIPIRDVIFEHRLYLSSVGFFWIISMVGSWLGQGLPQRLNWVAAVLLVMILTALSTATYQRNKVWRDRLTLWTDIAVKTPQKSRVRYNLGLAYAREGRLEDATREYRTAIRLKPDNSAAHNNLGNIYQHQGDLNDAIQEYHISIKLNPDYQDAHYNLGDAYQNQGRLDEAVQEYRMAIRLKPEDVAAHNNLGIIYMDQGRPEEAISEYRTALTLDPNYAKAHYNLGLVYSRLGKFEEAKRHHQEALRIQPDLEAVRKALESTPK